MGQNSTLDLTLDYLLCRGVYAYKIIIIIIINLEGLKGLLRKVATTPEGQIASNRPSDNCSQEDLWKM